MTKIIFLDFDGPMIPLRAYFLPKQTKPIVSMFDPCAVSLLNKLIDESGAQIVISSTWGMQGRVEIKKVLRKNGIDPKHLHKDWITPRKFSSSRHHEVKWWLDDHPEVTHSVAIDDESLHYDLVPNAVKCDAYEGFSWRNYLEARVFLDAFTDDKLDARDKTLSTIEWLKYSEINRLKRNGEPGEWVLREMRELYGNALNPQDDAD